MASAIEGAIGKNVAKEVAEQVAKQVTEQVGEQVGEQVAKQVTEQVGEQVAKQVTEQVGEQVAKQVTEQVGENVAGKIGQNVGDQVSGGAAKIEPKTPEGNTLKGDIDKSANPDDLVKKPSSAISDYIKANKGKIVALGLTAVGASLYFGIQAAKGKSPDEAYHDLVQAAADTTKDVVGVANGAAQAVLSPIADASGLTGFINQIKSFFSKFKIAFIVLIALCILSIFGAIVLKFM